MRRWRRDRPPIPPSPSRWLGRLLVATGVLPLALAFIVAAEWLLFSASAARAHGTIVDLAPVTSAGEDRDAMFPTRAVRPVVRFHTARGSFQILGTAVANPGLVRVGTEVGVIYPPGDPRLGRIDGGLGRLPLALMLGIVGGTATGLGGFVLRQGRRTRRGARLKRAG